MATNENLPPNVIKQLVRELKNLDETPPLGIKVGVNDDDFSTILKAQYENGVFRMKLLLSRDFPHSPPKGSQSEAY
ncbi:putative ubiquitin-conjugating enzyme E2, ubiquitin-conjugating enzyme/RWD [Helianthus annuus]|nr:putative ubiquitin-conjugating enzyme E2, ubiquitin-conjugating enzyme/RWD [Helianthus annuus]